MNSSNPKDYKIGDTRDLSSRDGALKIFLLSLLFTLTLLELSYHVSSNKLGWFWYWFILFILLVLHPVLSYFRREFDFFEVINIFLFSYFLQFFLSSVLIFLNEDWVVFSQYWEWSIFGKGLFYADVALIMFYLGYYSSLSGRLSRILKRVPFFHFDPNVSITRATIAFISFFFIYLLFVGFLTVRAGGIEAFIAGRGTTVQYGYGFTQPFISLGGLLVPFGYLYLYKNLSKNMYQDISSLFRKVIFFGISLAMLIASLSFRSRGTSLSWILMILVCKHYLERKASFKKMLIFIILFLFFSNIILIVRGELLLESLGQSFWKVFQTNFALSLTSSFASFEALLVILTHIPQELPYYGLTPIFESFVLPIIPRAIWPAKAAVYGADRIWEDIAGMFSTGTQYFVSMPGEFYAYLGFFGVVIGMFFIGVIFKSIYLTLQKEQPASVLLYSVFIVLIPGFIGGIPYTYVFLQYFALPILLLKYIHKTYKIGFRA